MLTTIRRYRVSGDVPLSVTSNTTWIDFPAASAGTITLASVLSAPSSLTSPSYVPASRYTNHRYDSAFPSGSLDAAADSVTRSPGFASFRTGLPVVSLLTTATGGWLASFGAFTHHSIRAA